MSEEIVEPYAELALRKPWWFRLLLRIPRLPSIVWMPDIMGLFCYALFPMLIIVSYIVAFIYIVVLVHSPVVFLLFTAIMAPLLLISASAKAHAFWDYWQLLVEKRFFWDTSKSLDEYIELLRKQRHHRV